MDIALETKKKIQKQALRHVLQRKQSTVNMSVGIGKTKLSIDYMCYLKSKKGVTRFEIVIPRRVFIKNWKTELEKFDAEHLLENLNFVTYKSFPKSVDNLPQAVILDECHNVTPSHEEVLYSLLNKEAYILGLTGTFPDNPRSEKAQLLNSICPISYTFLTDDAIEQGLLNDYTIHVHYLSLSSKKDILVKTKSKQWYTSEESNYQYANSKLQSSMNQFNILNRMRALSDTKSKIKYAAWLTTKLKGKTLLFANTVKQLNEVDFPCVHNKISNSDEILNAFKNDEFKVLGSIGTINEGANIPNLKNAIVVHSFSNPGKFKQRLGRILRLNPKDHAHIHVLCYKGTKDEEWLENALKQYKKEKIKYYDFTHLTL